MPTANNNSALENYNSVLQFYKSALNGCSKADL